MKVIIVGAGVVGYTIAEKLSSENHEVVLIERDEARVKKVKESLDVKVIEGSGSSPRVLKEAGIEHADMLIAVTDSDETNMIACLVANMQTRVPKKIARIRNPDYTGYPGLLSEGDLSIDFNINPARAAAERILKIIDVPGAYDVIDFSKGVVKLIGIRLERESELVGKRLQDLKALHPDNKVLIASIYRGSETIVPDGRVELKEDDLVFVVTVPLGISRVLKLFGKGEGVGRKFMVVGGGYIGLYIARHLEERNFLVKIIERDEKRCSYLAEVLDRTLILHGDGTDQELLKEEGIEDIDTFIAVTNDEEDNILISLLAKSLGASRVITLIDKPEYISLVSTIGVDVVVSPRLASVSSILQFVRKGKVLSVTTLMEERMEAIETIAMDTSDMVNKPIKKIKFPKGAIIGAVIRDDTVIIPDGETVIHPGDDVVIFALRKVVPKVEKSLMVKPEFF